MRIPAIGFAAWSGTGKTTVVEGLVRTLTARGLRVAVVKHDGHGFEIDREGKDSRRFTKAGAGTVLLTSPAGTAVMCQRGIGLAEALRQIDDADLILVEGFKDAPIPRIDLCRKATGQDFAVPPEQCIALVTDRDDVPPGIPRFAFEDTEGLAAFVTEEMTRLTQTDFTHFNEQGKARMVDVGGKDVTRRTATAAARVLVNAATFAMIRSGGMKKGDVLTVAQIAGIMGAKRTPDIIPMCHPIALSGIDLRLSLNEERLSVEIEATVSCEGRTGVEMEALTAASCAALTVYDMCKAVQKDMVIADLRLLSKTGGVHGDYSREEK